MDTSAKLNAIEDNADISVDVRDRISSAIRHLRIGDYQAEIEQQFINYWIGLEFIFASPVSGESTFERIKKFFIMISKSCYIKCHMIYLNNWLISSREILHDECFWDMDIDALTDKVGDILLKYRLKNIKAHRRNKDAVTGFLKNHERNLEQHLARIYRLRNELIHEAAIKQDIANVTSNLRSYLVFVLNQLIYCFSSDKLTSPITEMSEFFLEYESSLKLLEQDPKTENLMRVPYTKEYVY